MIMAAVVGADVLSSGMARPLDVVAVHDAHAAFVWKTLLRLGVREADAADLVQEVFVVVHEKRRYFDPGRAKVTTWLYGICLHLARNYGRKAYIVRERPTDEPELGGGAYDDAERVEARRTVARILDRLEPEQRALVVMFEVEGLTCPEIAEVLGVPVGTVYSRLSAAREALCAEAKRERRREGAER